MLVTEKLGNRKVYKEENKCHVLSPSKDNYF